MIKINSGWIVDGLIIAQPGKPVLEGGGQGGFQKTFLLESDEVINMINGANYNYGPRVTGQMTIVTNKRELGPFGQSLANRWIVSQRSDYFSLPIDDINLSTVTNDQGKKYLGPINNPHGGNDDNNGATMDPLSEYL